MRSAPLVLTLLLALQLMNPSIAQALPSAEIPKALGPLDDVPLPPIGFYRGLLPTPKEGEVLDSAYANASAFSQFVPVDGIPSPFYDLAEDLLGPWGERYVEELVRGNGMFPLVQLSFFDQDVDLVEPPGMSGSRLDTPAWRKAYHDSALAVVNASQPAFISIGMEANLWFERYGDASGDGNAFRHFVSLYEDIYGDIKLISPDTQVFCTFSREVPQENREADMSAMLLFDTSKMDRLALVSRPYTVSGVDRVADIPDDYYLSALEPTGATNASLTEVAWPSDAAFGGESEQAAFIRNVTGRLTAGQGIDLHMLGWPRLTDMDETDSLGLIDRSGGLKSGYRAFLMNSEPCFNRTGRIVETMEDFDEVRFDLGRVFFDPDPWDTLTFSVWNGSAYTNRTSSKVESRIEGHEMVFSSRDNVTGISQFKVKASDWMGWTNWTLIQVNVTGINDAPAIGPGFPRELSMQEGHSVSLDMETYVTDAEDKLEELTISVIISPALTVDLSSAPYFINVYAADYDWWGATFMLLRITDPAGLYLDINLTVTVVSVNDPPVLNLPGTVELEEDTPFIKDLSGWGADQDGSSGLVWSVMSMDPVNLSVRTDGAVLTIEPAPDWHGSELIFITLSDGSENDSGAVLVSVGSVNDAPEGVPPQNVTIHEDHAYFMNLSLLGPKDRDGDELFWKVKGFSEIVRSVQVLQNGTLKVQPGQDRYGQGYISLFLDDNRGGSTDLSFNVTILPVNDPPFFMSPNDWGVEVAEGGSKDIELPEEYFIIEDPDDPKDALVLSTDSVLCPVDGLTIKVSVPSGTAPGIMTVLVWLVDPQGAVSEKRELKITVVPSGPGPLTGIVVSEVTPDQVKGDVIITAKGAPSQTIWVVFHNGTSYRGSYLMKEEPPGSGFYIVTIRDPGWANGERLTFHLSLTEAGPNDSQVPESTIIYVDQESTSFLESMPFYLVLVLVVLAGILAFLYLSIRRRKGAGPLEE